MAEVPKRFEFSIGGYMGESFEIELIEESLTYRAFSHGYHLASTHRVSPTPQQWAHFRADLAAIEAASWRPMYMEPTVDGTRWHLKVSGLGLDVDSAGSNGYPSDSDPSISSPAGSRRFQSLLAAVSTLVGGRPVR